MNYFNYVANMSFFVSEFLFVEIYIILITHQIQRWKRKMKFLERLKCWNIPLMMTRHLGD